METSTLRWIVLVVLLAHGIGHILGFLESWTNIPAGFTEQPWLLSSGVTMEGNVGRAFGLLWLVALVAFLGAVFGLYTHQEWWRTLALAAAFISLFAILPWWNSVTAGARIRAVLVDLAVIVALLPGWGAQIAESLR
jgi:hypothetical protein